ncbi:MAG: GFA family protein [Paracoccaceae bacterium]|nr:GFA family protein [Paracoccaceae bacterium]
MSQNHHEGDCSCGRTRYRLTDTALIVHACHCKMCQVLTGGSYAVNVLIEAENAQLLRGETFDHLVDTPSGHGQAIRRCTTCSAAIWSVYRHFVHRTGCSVRFVRAGTPDHPEDFPTDVHIYTETRLQCSAQADKKPEFRGFYRLDAVWSEPSLRRLSLGASIAPIQQECAK